jgi:hypothetical protein
MSVRLMLIAAAGVLLLAGCASGGSGHAGTTSGSVSSSAAAHRPTVVRTFTPYSASGKLTVPVQGHATGHCWEISLAAPAPDAYRCLAANRILDPCFAPPTSSAKKGTSLACFRNPWAKAVLLHVHRLPRGIPMTTRPWAVLLATGEKCVAATGTAPFVAGVGLDYACGHGTAAALRDVDAKQVRALVGRVGENSLKHTTVRTLWRG